MWLLKILKFRGNTKKNVSVFFCIVFIIFCMFLLLLGFLWPQVWAVIYSTDDSGKNGVIILYGFASTLLVTCFLMLLALKQNSHREILCCLLAMLLLWQLHLLVCFVSLIMHTMNWKGEVKTVATLHRGLPLLFVQCVWLYFIATVWYYWRELSLFRDVPAFLHSLRMHSIRMKAIRVDQRERLGTLPKKLIAQLTPQARGLALADAS